MKFSSKEAIKYAKKGELHSWLQRFLTTEGKNATLAHGLDYQRRYWVGPKIMPLRKLTRCCGPEPSMKYHDPKERFEKRVNRMLMDIRKGWSMPPLIINYDKGKNTIADGNHRAVALKRAKITKAWTLVWYDTMKDYLKDNQLKPVVFFITGTSGAGKTTLDSRLSKELPFVKIHDIDEDGVPEGADENWRKGRTNELLQKAKAYHKAGNPTIILGQTVPQEIIASKGYAKYLDIHFGYIHIDEADIKKRLSGRGWTQDQIRDNINWATHLERFVKAEEPHYIVDGSKNGPKEVADKIRDWILREITK